MHRSLRTSASILLATLAVAVGPFATQAALAKGGGGGSSSAGGGAIALPADFPSAVPLPVGKLSSSTSWPAGSSSARWGVLLVVDGSFSTVMAQTLGFYGAAGFIEPIADEYSVYHVTNGAYDVTFTGAARDHSNSQTNLTVLVAPH